MEDKEFYKNECVDDLFAIDWLSGQHTGKREKLKRELERLDNCWGL